MDKNAALKMSKDYLMRVRNAQLGFNEAWIFGSYARDSQHENSDIDIAIILNDNEIHNFETDVKLMTIRQGEETMIEPHAFSKEEFNINVPLVSQILQYGERIVL